MPDSLRDLLRKWRDEEKAQPWVANRLDYALALAEQQQAEMLRLQVIVDTVDDVLIVNWVGPRVDGDYKRALGDLVSGAIKEHDDPAVSEVAAKRQAEIERLTEQVQAIISAASESGIYDGEDPDDALSCLTGELNGYSKMMWRIERLLNSGSARPDDVEAAIKERIERLTRERDEANAMLARYRWRPISEINEDYCPCIAIHLDDPGSQRLVHVCDADFEQSEWTHFAEAPKLTHAEAMRLSAAMLNTPATDHCTPCDDGGVETPATKRDVNGVPMCHACYAEYAAAMPDGNQTGDFRFGRDAGRTTMHLRAGNSTLSLALPEQPKEQSC